MFDLRKLFVREARGHRDRRGDPDSDYHPSDKPGEGPEVEYQGLIETQFRRWGISSRCVTIEVRRMGKAPDGFDVLIGMVRLAHWERLSGLRVLVGLPLLEAKVRKSLRASWLADYSHFGGLWLHASSRVPPEGAAIELRDALAQLVPPSAARGGLAANEPGVAYDVNSESPASSAAAPLTGAGESGRMSVPG